jgi:hypothetical protein
MPDLDLSALQDTPLIVSTETEVSLLAAGDPVFGDLKPDDFKAYVRFRIATAFPNVIGPEMNGRYFGFHPQVLVNSYRSLLHQQINLGHMLKAYGAYRDRIIGCAVGVAVGNLQRGPKQKIADSVAAAQYLDVVTVIYKAAEGVKDLLGNHTSARQKQSVSIESGAPLADYSVYDPRDQSIVTLQSAMEMYPDLIKFHKEKGLQIGKIDGSQFALAPGGEDGLVQFKGVGVTPSPAERNTARIIDLKAAGSDDVCLAAAMCMPEWEPGQSVRWMPIALHGQDAGRGTVTEVIESGSVTRHGMTKTADPSDPLLEIKVHGKGIRVVRHASSVRKIPA